MDAKRALAICTGTGLVEELDPSKPKPRSLKFTMMRNAMYIGYCYVSPDCANPQAEAFRIGRSHGCNEAWHGSPSDMEPCSFVCAR